MVETVTAMLAFAPVASQTETRWFSPYGCVVYHGDRIEVFVGGTLVASYEPSDRGMRNLMLCMLAQEPRVRKVRLAQAFGVSRDTVRKVRQQAASEGMAAVYGRKQSGRPSVVTPALRRRLERLFDDGATVPEAHGKVRKRHDMSAGTVRRAYQRWKKTRATQDGGDVQTTTVSPTSPAVSEQKTLPLESTTAAQVPQDEIATTTDGEVDESTRSTCQSEQTSMMQRPRTQADKPESGDPEPVAESEVTGGRQVQHVGSWLLVAVVAQLGLHDCVARLWKRRPGGNALRIALDAMIVALAIGQQCVEGIRRLATPTASVLLRAERAPSASWVRRLWHRFVEQAGSVALHWSMAGVYLREARQAREQPAVFYVDNHMRPYTGKHVLRRGWRMQDKRARPGVTDYYVHDQDGRAVLRVDVASHDSLTQWLSPIAKLLRAGLGAEPRIVLTFDRAGAFPEQMATLRDDGFEFVTYERRPYALMTPAMFEQVVTVRGKRIEVCDRRMKNLGSGRGRVRRIALRMPDKRQINLLAISEAPAQQLIEIMMGDSEDSGGRWVQENAFKHGAQRWGNNQLDGRKVDPYDPETVIPNPARRRLDRALQMARVREGLARRDLARLADGDSRHERKRERAQQDLAEALAEQTRLEALRPTTPTHAPLQDTELAGRLVRHDGHYKTALDTIRIACANAESDLACALAPHLPNPAEAKQALANLFVAPGDVRVSKRTIWVTLQPAATAAELDAFDKLFAVVNGWNLTLPGDPEHRRLRFRAESL